MAVDLFPHISDSYLFSRDSACLKTLDLFFAALVTNRFYGNAVGESTFERNLEELTDMMKVNKCKKESIEKIHRQGKIKASIS